MHHECWSLFCFNCRSLAKSTHRIYFAALAARRQGSVAGCLGRRAPNALHRSVVDSGSTRAGVRPPTRPGYGRAAASSPISISQLCTGIRYLKCASRRHCPQCRILCLCKEHVLCVGASLGKADTFDASHAKADDAMMCELSCWPAYFSGHRRSLCQAILKPIHSPSQIFRSCARQRISASVQRCPRRHHRWRSCRRRLRRRGRRKTRRSTRSARRPTTRRTRSTRRRWRRTTPGRRSENSRRGRSAQQQAARWRQRAAATQRKSSTAAVPFVSSALVAADGPPAERLRSHAPTATPHRGIRGSEGEGDDGSKPDAEDRELFADQQALERTKPISRKREAAAPARQHASSQVSCNRGRAISCSWRGDQGASML